MSLDAEARLDGIETLRRRRFGVVGFESGREGKNVGGYLVTAFGAALVRQQRGEPAGVQGALGFVESRPGDPVAFGDFADTDSVDPVTPHHLVPDLEQIVRIEEPIADEQGIADGLGTRIECAIPRQRFLLWIPTWRFRHVQLCDVVTINTPHTISCQWCVALFYDILCRIRKISRTLFEQYAASLPLHRRRN
jgi:hypothetical protein